MFDDAQRARRGGDERWRWRRDAPGGAQRRRFRKDAGVLLHEVNFPKWWAAIRSKAARKLLGCPAQHLVRAGWPPTGRATHFLDANTNLRSPFGCGAASHGLPRCYQRRDLGRPAQAALPLRDPLRVRASPPTPTCRRVLDQKPNMRYLMPSAPAMQALSSPLSNNLPTLCKRLLHSPSAAVPTPFWGWFGGKTVDILCVGFGNLSWK